MRYGFEVLVDQRQALRWEMILEVPTKGLKLPRIRRREMRVLGIEEAKTFLKFALPPMYRTLFAVAITNRNASEQMHRPQVAGRAVPL
jgi:3-deoxy-D-arabino-heptulosonate 7-phosphate (DAHP) synthase